MTKMEKPGSYLPSPLENRQTKPKTKPPATTQKATWKDGFQDNGYQTTKDSDPWGGKQT